MNRTFEKVNDVKINYEFTKRREGDIATCYANVDKAKNELNWEAQLGIEDMCKDAYNYALVSKVDYEKKRI